MSRGEEKAKRWTLLQFSVRSLLLLMLIVASFFAGWQAHQSYLDKQYRDGKLLAPVKVEINTERIIRHGMPKE